MNLTHSVNFYNRITVVYISLSSAMVALSSFFACSYLSSAASRSSEQGERSHDEHMRTSSKFNNDTECPFLWHNAPFHDSVPHFTIYYIYTEFPISDEGLKTGFHAWRGENYNCKRCSSTNLRVCLFHAPVEWPSSRLLRPASPVPPSLPSAPSLPLPSHLLPSWPVSMNTINYRGV